jgi:hypothetical protein
MRPAVPSTKRLARLAIVAGLAALATGCIDYTNRYEGVTLATGDAVYANRAIQTIDPWPQTAFRTTIPSDGQRVMRGMNRYTPPANGNGATPVIIPVPAQ